MDGKVTDNDRRVEKGWLAPATVRLREGMATVGFSSLLFPFVFPIFPFLSSYKL
ncbi:hypothetical protein HYC85_026138 [Camellia sinensis]|uniref:Uncharacterized protein n=1 Tax=Camellia sinensis TaxID=4442 RepID=A0A7J7G2U7_CAMSI|nr:hypothetical protein HYC85_026138 [Camellia sinensis]